MDREQILRMTANERNSLRANCTKALGGANDEEASRRLALLEDVEAEMPKVKPGKKLLRWTSAGEGKHLGKLHGSNRFELMMEENHTDTNLDVWSVYLEGKLIGRERYVKDAKMLAEKSAAKHESER